jgi:hypothetical protein
MGDRESRPKCGKYLEVDTVLVNYIWGLQSKECNILHERHLFKAHEITCNAEIPDANQDYTHNKNKYVYHILWSG